MTLEPAPPLESPLHSGIAQFCDALRAEARTFVALAARLRRKLDDPQSASQLLAEGAAIFKRIDTLREEAVRIAEHCDRNAQLAFLELEAAIRDMCTKRQWRLDGQWPDFIIEYGVPVHISEKEKVITVGSRTRVVPGTLEKTLAVATAELIPKKFSPNEFMEELETAYDAAACGASSQVPVYDVYKKLVIQGQSSRFWRDAGSAFFTPMSIDQFRARVSRMLEAGIGAAKDRRELRLFPPLNPKDAVFLFQPSERRFGFVGRIEFLKP